MDTKTFLTRVSAALDDLVICLWKPDPAQPNGMFWNRGSFKDFDDAVAAIQMWDKDPDWTVYFSVGRMANNSVTDPSSGKVRYKRSKDHASWFKAICFDMDIGADKKYATQKEGLRALVDAAKKIGLPDPLVVNSGRGIHFYWPLLEPIPRITWEGVSIALRMALQEHEVEIDTSKIHDASMVLRPVGTSHKKQKPWRAVSVVSDCPDYDIKQLSGPLSHWIGKAAIAVRPSNKSSALTTALLRTCDLNIPVIAKKCAQLGAVLSSGGEFDALGRLIQEPFWRDTLGIAAHGVDPEAAMMMLSQGHPTFTHAAGMQKMSEWTTGPTLCTTFNAKCPGVCGTCPHQGKITSPAALNEEILAPLATPTALAAVAAGAPPPTSNMPPGYYVNGGAIYRDVTNDVKSKDTNGNTVITPTVTRTLVCPYEIHVVAVYHDVWKVTGGAVGAATAVVSVKYPHEGVVEHELPVSALFVGGRELQSFFANILVVITSPSTFDLTQKYLMNYLQRVQAASPAGVDFKSFGWQEDGSFLCGETLVGSPTGNTLRRLQKTAKMYSQHIRKSGSREVWADTMKLADEPGGEYIGIGILTAVAGALGNVGGSGTPLVSFYATDTTTGKTLALMAGNSTYMTGDIKAMFNVRDTPNAFYKGIGTLCDLSGALDEYTDIEDPELARSLAYDASNAREKIRLTSEGETREPAFWRSPIRVSTNKSLYEMFEMGMAQNDPLRMRTLEFQMEGREFVEAHGPTIYRCAHEHFGHVFPELAQGILSMGGRQAAYDRGLVAFESKKFLAFRSEERFFRGLIIPCYIMGKIGQKLGLFRFNIERIISAMCARVVEIRALQAGAATDAFDIVGQFLQEYNHQLLTTRTEFGKTEQVQFPVPDVAVARLEVVYDAATPVLPGSKLSINDTVFKKWIVARKDSHQRVLTELRNLGGVLDARRRVTMYKGCQKANPGQAQCLVVNLLHPRMAAVLSGRPIPITSPAAAVLGNTAAGPTSSQQT